MKRFIPSPAMGVALTALFVALSGSSYAAVQLHANSVTSRTIRNGSIRMADLSPSVRPQKTNKLFRAAVSDVVLDPSTQAAVDALAGAVQGAPGPAGAAGPAGGQGPSGTATVTTREAFGPTVGASTHTGTTATCQAGEKIVGGGVQLNGTPSDGFLLMSAPDGNNGWSGEYETSASAGTSARAHVFALCATA